MTENAKSEANLSFLDNPENLRNILEETGDGIYITDKERHILFWNSACEKITGYTAEEVHNKRCADGILEHVDMAGNPLCSTALCPLHKAISTGKASEKPVHLKAKHKNGSRFVVEVSVAPVRDKKGAIIGGVEIFRDVSEKVAMEEERARFFNSLNNEIITPLTNIHGYLDLLLSGDAGKLTETQKEFLETIYGEKEKLLILIENLLEISRYESKIFSYEQEILDMSELLLKVTENFREEAAEKNVAIITELPDKMLIKGDRESLWQAFNKLIENAVKYTKEGKVEVALSHSEESNEIAVTIKDSGIGISPENLQNIFKMFYRIDDSERLEAKGTGVGMYIADKIIRQHEGRIDAESTPEEGSIFKVYLPGLRMQLDKKKILVADADKSINRMITFKLQREGFEVFSAANGKEALEIFEKEQPQAVITEIMLPITNGLDILKKIRQEDASLPVIILSSKSNENDIMKGLELGASEYLGKPFRPGELLLRLKKLLGG